LPALALSWGAGTLWILASPPLSLPKKPITNSKKHLLNNLAAVRDYMAINQSPPKNLNHLRLWAKANDKKYFTYDGFAERFEYERLTSSQYYLRSFGPKGKQSTMLESPSPSLLKWGKKAKRGLRYKYPTKAELNFFPSVVLDSSESPNGVWRAKLFVDINDGERRLIVRDSRKKTLFMVAEHDSVEEYLWLSSGYQIVFSATSSDKYRDGIYLWNLTTGKLTNLIDKLGREGPVPPSDTGLKLFISLSGVDVHGPTVYAFVGENLGGSLSPSEFYSPKHFYGIVIPEDTDEKPSLKSYENTPLSAPLVNTLSLGKQLQKNGGGLISQNHWMQLPLKGDSGFVLNTWQEFLSKDTSPAIMPYGLWYLSVIYAQSFSEMPYANIRDREILRSYGAEIALTLANLKYAPSYLKGMASHVAKELMSGRSLPYQLASLSHKTMPKSLTESSKNDELEKTPSSSEEKSDIK
jgi:hypothetical protein